MIAYDLRCEQGHVFEVWFKDHPSFVEQKETGRVECPSCGSTSVEIAWTGCAVRTEHARELPPPRDSFRQELARFLEKNFEDVGREFAEEARRIHHGEAGRRNIRGCTTEEEDEALLEEGIKFVKIPLPRLDG